MKSERALLSFLQNQIKIEKEIAESLEKSIGEIANPAVKGALRGISLDSAKHAEMYTAAVKLLTSTLPKLTQEFTQYHLEKQKKLIDKHIEIEVNLINEINRTLPIVENEQVRLLLNTVLQDEKRHHELLKKMLNILFRGEVLSEEWWNLLRAEYEPRW
ncbi:MAG: ferritin-like domain-containing protein [Candidatus Bathyarchaeota archaeon]|nr:MAG: ferritin-like domain-containing protein [Candidatus Bathyarchaeota archaeon]